MKSFFPEGFPFTKRTVNLAPAVADASAAAERSPAAEAAEAAPSFVTSHAPALSPRAQQERRRSPRQTLVAKATIRPDAPVIAPTSVSTGFVSNISMNGVGFHTRRPLAVGEKYRMNLEVGPMRWTSRMRVVSCRPHESGTYDVGAEFVGNDLMSRALAA